MQSIKRWIPTAPKQAYLRQLLRVGFHALDCAGSFVSPKAIPQMADTAGVAALVDLSESPNQKLSVIDANVRGARTASSFSQGTYLGLPHFSISENFQMRKWHPQKTMATAR